MTLLGGAGVAGASVSTDKWLYNAGDTVQISGDQMQPAENVAVDIYYPDGTLAQDHVVVASDAGTFADTYTIQPTDPAGVYTVDATGQTSGSVYTTTFDPSAQSDCLHRPGGNDPPVKPTTSLAGTDLTVSWSNVCADPDNYIVYRSTLSKTTDGLLDGRVKVGEIDSPPKPNDQATLSVVDKNVACGTYYYQVEANRAGSGQSDQSWTSNSAVSDPITRACNVDLQVRKTVDTVKYNKTYSWQIAKTVDKTLVEQIGGGTATFNYTVTATPDSGTPSDWEVDGTITVTNPNGVDFSGVNVTDAVSDCTVADGTNVTVRGNGAVTLNYSCKWSTDPTSTITSNTAEAAWDKSTYGTPDDSASSDAVTIDWAGATVKPVNESVTITDTFNGVTTTLGTPDASNTFTDTYSRTVTVPQWNCASYPNTARIVETNQTASQTVEVCGPAKTGALTMGFWQNKNGQAIITASATTAGVAKLTTWVRQYNPFADLPVGATPTQVASYVTNVIKAANASGASMNAMLKAQMLSTALDVYFSDPGLGGNKIGAPAPIGGVKIDLTKICHMIDGSGGTATCSGTYEDTSSAFGGAASLSISALLGTAAGQSNAGGSVWYGNVKAVQQLAKDTFDAINNQVVFAP